MPHRGVRGEHPHDAHRTMKPNPQVLAFMTPFPYSIDIDEPVVHAHQTMRAHHFRHLPVTSAGKIVGVLTDRDIKLVLGPDFGYPREEELKVRDAYVEQPCIVSASTPVAVVARTMAEKHIGSAIVVKGNKLVGIFTVTDACRALADVLKIPDSESDDAA
jgi:CBS domain-containing protein